LARTARRGTDEGGTDGVGPLRRSPDEFASREANRQGADNRQRIDRIREYVLVHHSVSPTELARRFGVSVMTVHRDLTELEQQGVVRRFRGGVTAQPSAVFESNVAYRIKAMKAEKDAIAAHARRLVEPGMAVLLDDSTTSLALARCLDDISPLIVVTNHLGILETLSQARDLRLIGLGGDYNAKYNSFVGMSCVAAVESLRVDIAFVSAYGVYGNHAYHQEQEIVAGKRAMLASSERKVLSVDHSKLGRKALHQVCRLSVFDLLIVDDGASVESLRELEEAKVRYELARMDPVPPPPSRGQGALTESERTTDDDSVQ
jgi:DeoR/GlpR family transcriptional regulator of sugar metabolism